MGGKGKEGKCRAVQQSGYYEQRNVNVINLKLVCTGLYLALRVQYIRKSEERECNKNVYKHAKVISS